jgi:hypothetical protein
LPKVKKEYTMQTFLFTLFETDIIIFIKKSSKAIEPISILKKIKKVNNNNKPHS